MEDGTEFTGCYFTEAADVVGEVVFNTAMSGYQEVLTDPSYSSQCVVMTYPMIGNYGINDSDVESSSIYLSALICKEYVDHPSNWQSVKTVKTYLEDHQRVGIERVDTRSLTLHVRDHGAQRLLITSDLDTPAEQLIGKIKSFPSMVGKNLANVVSTDSLYDWPVSKTVEPKFRIAVLDCGVKYNILRHLANRGCQCDVLPIDSAQAAMESNTYHGLFISNGPGDPEPVEKAVFTDQESIGEIAYFWNLFGASTNCTCFRCKNI